ncbi:hypothetical protein [Frankia tisae]|uniref:hypothetical protein n=1 Tax=Frankia tisae TaxID=2950104 RepID=UPI0021BFBBB3|nr:hypothetical protein [Frankia tisae]
MPAPLATEWRWWAAKHIQGAIAAEEKMGKEGRTDEVLASVTEMAARLTPTKEKVGRAVATDDDAADQVAQNRANGYGPPSTPQITKALTAAVLDFARTVLGPNCRAYRELRLPVVPGG